MKSGSTVERRDQVLIGRLSFDSRAASTFFNRCPSTNGPFFMERAISYLLSLVAALHDHLVGTLVGTRPITFGRLSPRTAWNAAFTRTAFTTAVRVIDRVHCDAPHGRADAAPAIGTGLADLAQRVLGVADFADGRTTIHMHPANLARTQTKLSVTTFSRQQLSRSAR